MRKVKVEEPEKGRVNIFIEAAEDSGTFTGFSVDREIAYQLLEKLEATLGGRHEKIYSQGGR